MSFSLNIIMLAGRLTADPVSKTIGANAVVKFTMAVNERYKKRDGDTVENTLFLECEAWAKTGELVMAYLTKGSPVYVQGKLRIDQWTDPDGKKHSRHKAVIDSVQFLPNKSEALKETDAPGTPMSTPETGDQVPF